MHHYNFLFWFAGFKIEVTKNYSQMYLFIVVLYCFKMCLRSREVVIDNMHLDELSLDDFLLCCLLELLRSFLPTESLKCPLLSPIYKGTFVIWTLEQKFIISKTVCSLLVLAASVDFKTASLVRRVNNKNVDHQTINIAPFFSGVVTMVCLASQKIIDFFRHCLIYIRRRRRRLQQCENSPTAKPLALCCSAIWFHHLATFIWWYFLLK